MFVYRPHEKHLYRDQGFGAAWIAALHVQMVSGCSVWPGASWQNGGGAGGKMHLFNKRTYVGFILC